MYLGTINRSLRCSLLAAALLLACHIPRASASPPAPTDSSFVHLTLHRSSDVTQPDTLITSTLCTTSTGAVFSQCGFHGSAGALTVLAPAAAFGSTLTVKILCAVSGPVTLTAALYGITSGFNNSADTPSVTVTGDPCPTHTAGMPDRPVFPLLHAVSGGG